ncbi:MAG: hypothetical protein M1457_06895 [bacterium]|nr:hypothetical protein [bacterium]
MDLWLEWARGPLFRIAIAFLILGLVRHVAIAVFEIAWAVRRAGDKNIPYRKLARATLAWLVPAGKLGHRPLYGLTTLAFHVSIVIVPLFLGGHIALWARATDLAWPAIPNLLADVLTVIATAAAVLLVIERIAARGPQMLSRFSDYAFPLLIAVVFGSGFLAMHPALSPVAFRPALLVHALGANLILIFIPFSKLSHVILMPLTHLISEVAWHFPPHAGSEVGLALGKENEPV